MTTVTISILPQFVRTQIRIRHEYPLLQRRSIKPINYMCQKAQCSKKNKLFCTSKRTHVTSTAQTRCKLKLTINEEEI